MNKSLGLWVIALSLGLFFLLQWLSVAPYVKYTVLIFGIGLGIVLLTVLPLLAQMGTLEEESNRAEEADAVNKED